MLVLLAITYYIIVQFLQSLTFYQDSYKEHNSKHISMYCKASSEVKIPYVKYKFQCKYCVQMLQKLTNLVSYSAILKTYILYFAHHLNADML